MDTQVATAPRPRFSLALVDWLALVVCAAVGGYGYNVAVARDELVGTSIGTALAIGALSWLAGRVQWAAGGRRARGGRTAFRIALVALAAFACVKGLGRVDAQAQSRAVVAQVAASVTGFRRAIDVPPPDAIARAYSAELDAQRRAVAATPANERSARSGVVESVAEAFAPQIELTHAMGTLRDSVPMRMDTLGDAGARGAILAQARALVARGETALAAVDALPARADAALVLRGVGTAPREALRQWFAANASAVQLRAWIDYGRAVEAFYAGLEAIDGQWSLSADGQLRVDNRHLETLRGWVAEHERAAAAIGVAH